VKHIVTIDQRVLKKSGLPLNKYLILDLLNHASSWADPITIKGETFYFTARQMIASELEYICDGIKPDTVYRILVWLHEKGYINYQKNGKQDCCKVETKTRQYFKEIESDENPKEDENNSEQIRETLGTDPTYPTTRFNPTTKTKKPDENLHAGIKAQKQKDKTEGIKKLHQHVAANWLTVLKNVTANSIARKWEALQPVCSIDDVIAEIQRCIDLKIYTSYDRQHITVAIENAVSALSCKPVAEPVPEYAECTTAGCNNNPHSADGRCFECMAGRTP